MHAVTAAMHVRPAAVPTCCPQQRQPRAVVAFKALRSSSRQQIAAAPRRQQRARPTDAAATGGWQRRRQEVVVAAAGGASDLPHDFAERKERLESGSEDFSQLTQQIEVGGLALVCKRLRLRLTVLCRLLVPVAFSRAAMQRPILRTLLPTWYSGDCQGGGGGSAGHQPVPGRHDGQVGGRAAGRMPRCCMLARACAGQGGIRAQLWQRAGLRVMSVGLACYVLESAALEAANRFSAHATRSTLSFSLLQRQVHCGQACQQGAWLLLL